MAELEHGTIAAQPPLDPSPRQGERYTSTTTAVKLDASPSSRPSRMK
jgi:hypothetical protein